jgi:hypothetical protein
VVTPRGQRWPVTGPTTWREGQGGEAPVNLEKKRKRAALTEQWRMTVPLASFSDARHCPAKDADKK